MHSHTANTKGYFGGRVLGNEEFANYFFCVCVCVAGSPGVAELASLAQSTCLSILGGWHYKNTYLHLPENLVLEPVEVQRSAKKMTS